MKSKVRFDGIDVAAMVAHLNRVALGRRVINIYNGPNGDTYIFKMDKLTSANDGQATMDITFLVKTLSKPAYYFI